MTRPSFTEQVDAVNRLLRQIENRAGRGESPAVDLAEFKSAVDDLRLRPLGVAADALARAVVEADPTFASRKPTR